MNGHRFDQIFKIRGRRVRCQACERVTTLHLVTGDRIRRFGCPHCGGRLRTFAWFARRLQSLPR